MSDDIRAKAQAVLSGQESRDAYAGDLARHVLATEARLDVALRGALQSREEMREWLGSDEAWDAVSDAVADGQRAVAVSSHEAWVIRTTLAALIAAMPGGDA